MDINLIDKVSIASPMFSDVLTVTIRSEMAY